MNYILFDDKITRLHLLPFTFTRPIADIRIGITTIGEKWVHYLSQNVSTLTENYLKEKYPLLITEDNTLINASVLPNSNLVEEIKNLDINQALFKEDSMLALRVPKAVVESYHISEFSAFSKKIQTKSSVSKVERVWDIFTKNDKAIKDDFSVLTLNKTSKELSPTNKLIGENIFIEERVKAECAVFNSTTGPIYIGKDTEIMEGSVIRGPFALCESSVLKLASKIYGGTTIGPHCKVGGEVVNSVIFGYSNKAHDGFLGNSVIGEWCNLGADTNNSNLKNNYSNVEVWNYYKETFVDTGLQFCGLIMGDHSKCSINTMFNTGTVVGVNANIFGGGFPPKFIPSFSWGGAGEFNTFKPDKALEVAERMFARRGKNLDKREQNILEQVYKLTAKYRNWEEH